MESKINIVFAADAKYAEQLAVTIASLGRRTDPSDLRIYVLNGDDLDKRALEALLPDFELHLVDVSDWELARGTVNNDFLSSATYYRLAIPKRLPEYVHRAIYLDSDLLVLGDVTELWNSDLRGYSIGAVLDAGFEGADLAKRLGFEQPFPYFNAGVMVLDLEQLRECRDFDRATALCKEQVLKYEDQDALNAILKGKWAALDPNWNFQRSFLYDGYANWRTVSEVAPNPKIIHFTSALKPWMRGEWHPLAWLYLREAQRLVVRGRMLDVGKLNWLIKTKWLLRYLHWRLRLPGRWRFNRFRS